MISKQQIELLELISDAANEVASLASFQVSAPTPTQSEKNILYLARTMESIFRIAARNAKAQRSLELDFKERGF